jgi:hypothetical protein
MAAYTIEHVAQFDSALIAPIADMLAQLTSREASFGEQELHAIIENPASQLFILRDGNTYNIMGMGIK